ncbi:MAG: CRISPR-associated helicase Cas3' [Desulfovibrio sp.]|jgi:CRISPR-associated endonuclease/helicase Cas3|nr:CRISPR-associated helicase Cas3' [Desulfovibrio sp.]
METEYILWGKSDKETGARHPLLAHLADVAAVMEKMLSLPVFRQRMEKAMGKRLTPALLARLCVLACLHDLGKFAPGFQQLLRHIKKCCDHLTGQCCNHVESLYGLPPAKLLEAFPWLWQWTASEATLISWLLAVFSHHGTTILLSPSDQGRRARPDRFWKPRPDLPDPWKGLEDLNTLLQRWFPQAFAAAGKEDALSSSPAAQHIFAGLLMLADWIGSDISFFPYCGKEGRDGPGADPMPFARRAAARALEAIGLDVGIVRPFALPSFQRQFPSLPEPRPAQAAIDDLPLPDPGEGSLVLLEAETGSGKTEAALRHFTRLFAAGAVDSLYFANPLRFAATELHGRVVKFAGQTFGGALPTVLAIPGSIRMDDAIGHRLPGYKVGWEDSTGLMAGRGWAAEHAKRFLCAPLGVGTIDQALLAALLVPHAHLRAAALQRSLLVVDEVHASDAYMTRITCSLLELFRLVGGHVLLMSATLGVWAKERYLAVWRGSPFRDAAVPSRQEAEALPYPRLALVPSASGDPAIAPPLTPSSGGQKQVRMRCLPLLDDPEGLARLVAPYVEKGACVLIVRNTVRQARRTFTALRKLLPPEALFRINGVPAPHHSRYAVEDRQNLDRRVSACFGKGARRPSEVLVSTQTLEQSLDVDFDLLITDICPADVLLQRIGRLFRHDRAGRAVDEPVCIVLTPREEIWLLSQEARRFGFGRERPYDGLVGVLATWRMAQRDEIWSLPRDNRRLVEGATHTGSLLELAGELGPSWTKDIHEWLGRTAAEHGAAASSCLRWSKPFPDEGNVISGAQGEKISTRLGLQDRLLRFSRPVSSPLGNTVSEIRLPGWFFPAAEVERGADGDEVPQVPVVGEKGYFHFAFSGIPFYYTASGLMTQKEWDEKCTISLQTPSLP